jgi:hypothetical protein
VRRLQPRNLNAGDRLDSFPDLPISVQRRAAEATRRGVLHKSLEELVESDLRGHDFDAAITSSQRLAFRALRLFLGRERS